MNWIVVIAVPVLLSVLFVVIKGRKYNALYSPAHFIELAHDLQRAKDSACRNIGDPPKTPPTDDDRVILSSCRIASMYTVEQLDGRFLHYFSISIAGSYTPHAIGGMFTVYFTNLLRIPHDKLQLGISPANVYHCRYELTAGEHDAVQSLRIPIPTDEAAVELHRQSMVDRDKLDWARMPAA